MDNGLTPDQVSFFHTNGYLILPGALSPETVSTLLSTTHALLDEFDISAHPLTRFTTGGESGAAHVGDEYFLTSGDKVRFFFEEDAFNERGELVREKSRAVNKIGHYLHALVPAFARASLNPTNAAIAASLGFKDPRVLQSMTICKQPEIGGAVPPHQDSAFLYTNPPSAVGFWYALEDATVENGCLSFAPGSHQRAAIKSRFVRKAEGAGTEFVEVQGARFPRDSGAQVEDGREEEYVLGEVKAGDLVLIHGNVLHKSERNTSGKSRVIYTFHVIEGQEEYDERNWLQPPEGGFSRL